MTGPAAPFLLERTEPRRDGRAGADAVASLMQGDAFARVLDATLERGADAPSPAAREDASPSARRNDRDAPRPVERAGNAEARPEPGADRRAETAGRDRAEQARAARPDADAAEEAGTEAPEAETEAAETADPSAETADAPAEGGDDALQDLLKLMSPTALRAFQAAAGGAAAEAVAGVAGAGGAARLPAGMRPILMTDAGGSAMAEAASEPPVPPARVVGQVLQALSRAEGLSEGRGTVKLALDPAHLGKVEVTVARRDGQLEVTFKVESAEAEHALRSRAGELGQALLGKGAGWNQVNVSVVRDGEDEQDAAGHERNGDPDGRHGQQDQDEADSDGGEQDA